MGKLSKRKKNFYLPPSKRQKSDGIVGTVGFMATCNTHEDVCMREGYQLLNQFADKLYGPEQLHKKEEDTTTTAGEIKEESCDTPEGEDQDEGDSSGEEEDLDAALQKEVATLKATSGVPDATTAAAGKEGRPPRPLRRFQSVRCGAVNNVFIRTTLTDPLPTLLAVMDRIIETSDQLTKHLIRLLPVHSVCKAYLDKIEKALAAFCTDRFTGKDKTFYIVLNVRSNSAIKKDELLSVVLKVMEEVAPECKPVLTKDADAAIVITVLLTNCFIGEAPHYLDRYKKYNLIELAASASADAKKLSDNNKVSVQDVSSAAQEEKSAEVTDPSNNVVENTVREADAV